MATFFSNSVLTVETCGRKLERNARLVLCFPTSIQVSLQILLSHLKWHMSGAMGPWSCSLPCAVDPYPASLPAGLGWLERNIDGKGRRMLTPQTAWCCPHHSAHIQHSLMPAISIGCQSTAFKPSNTRLSTRLLWSVFNSLSVFNMKGKHSCLTKWLLGHKFAFFLTNVCAFSFEHPR